MKHRNRLAPGARLCTAAVLALAACASCSEGSATEEAAGTTSASSTSASSSSGAPVHCPGQPSGAPVELAETMLNPSGIAVDETNVYWIVGVEQGDTTSVYSCDVCGCDHKPKLVASVQEPMGISVSVSGSIAVDETSVYWTILSLPNIMLKSNGSVMKCAKGGCGGTPTVLAANRSPEAIALDAKNVYWIDDQNGLGRVVMRCAKGGCNGEPTLVVSGPPEPRSLAVDAMNLYWTSSTPPAVLECSLEDCGGMPTTLFALGSQSMATPTSIAVDATNVYWTLDQTSDAEVSRCPIAGCLGVPTVLASQQGSPAALAVGGANAYWLQLGPGGETELMKCSTGGCGDAPTTLGSQLGDVGAVAADATSVYFAADGKIMKMPK